MQVRRAWVFMPKCWKLWGTIWNKISVFKGNIGGASEAETLIEGIQCSSF